MSESRGNTGGLVNMSKSSNPSLRSRAWASLTFDRCLSNFSKSIFLWLACTNIISCIFHLFHDHVPRRFYAVAGAAQNDFGLVRLRIRCVWRKWRRWRRCPSWPPWSLAMNNGCDLKKMENISKLATRWRIFPNWPQYGKYFQTGHKMENISKLSTLVSGSTSTLHLLALLMAFTCSSKSSRIFKT